MRNCECSHSNVILILCLASEKKGEESKLACDENITGNKTSHETVRGKVTTAQTPYTAVFPALTQELLQSEETSTRHVDMDAAEVRAWAKLDRRSSFQYLNNPHIPYKIPPHSFSSKEQVIVRHAQAGVVKAPCLHKK